MEKGGVDQHQSWKREGNPRPHGRFSPGLFTAMVLFFPVAIACYWRAAADGSLDAGTLIGSLGLGALLMASPVVLLKVKERPYFRQDH